MSRTQVYKTKKHIRVQSPRIVFKRRHIRYITKNLLQSYARTFRHSINVTAKRERYYQYLVRIRSNINLIFHTHQHIQFQTVQRKQLDKMFSLFIAIHQNCTQKIRGPHKLIPFPYSTKLKQEVPGNI